MNNRELLLMGETQGTYRWLLQGVVTVMLLLAGCAGQEPQSYAPSRSGEFIVEREEGSLARLGCTVQVGAFSRLENGVRLMEALQGQGLDAYYFKDADGLFKVRFGDFGSRASARQRAVDLRHRGVIEAFYIVKPSEYAVAAVRQRDGSGLRQSLTKTAERFLGVPYKWGGESAKEGFDCSGLAMTVYRLNGLNLPRNSRQQFRAGHPVVKEQLQPGDLVFFATKGGKRVNHVGIYLGDDRFIHAPRTGKTIRIASLANSYFVKRFRGGRTYLASERLAGRS